MAFSSKLLMAAIASTALLGTTALVNADTVSYTTSIATQTNAGTFSPALVQFDPSLGNLTAATVNFSLALHPAETEFNPLAAEGSPFTVTLKDLTFNLLDPYAVTSSQFYDFTGNLAYSASGVTAAPSFTFIQSFPAPDVAFTAASGVPTANLGDYIGASTFSPTFTDSSLGTTAITGPSFVGYDLSFDGSATVTYTFTPTGTPEPASLSLLALSGAGLLLRRRRSN